jgi:hypothetical protein
VKAGPSSYGTSIDAPHLYFTIAENREKVVEIFPRLDARATGSEVRAGSIYVSNSIERLQPQAVRLIPMSDFSPQLLPPTMANDRQTDDAACARTAVLNCGMNIG